MACPPQKKLAILRTLHATICPSENYAEALILAAQTLADVNNPQFDPTTVTSMDAALITIAGLIPDDFVHSAPLPAPIRDILKEVAVVVAPKERNQQGNHVGAVVQGSSTTVVVESASERELRDKYVVYGGVRLWRHTEPPYTALYAHNWVGKSFEQWKTEFENFCGDTTVQALHAHRQSCTERVLRSWFAWTESVTRADDLNPAQVRQFQSTIELLLEAYLLRKGVPNVPNQAAATLAFATATEKRRHENKVTDYFSDLAEARKAAPAPNVQNSMRR
jgi:hypothetical protein